MVHIESILEITGARNFCLDSAIQGRLEGSCREEVVYHNIATNATLPHTDILGIDGVWERQSEAGFWVWTRTKLSFNLYWPVFGRVCYSAAQLSAYVCNMLLYCWNNCKLKLDSVLSYIRVLTQKKRHKMRKYILKFLWTLAQEDSNWKS